MQKYLILRKNRLKLSYNQFVRTFVDQFTCPFVRLLSKVSSIRRAYVVYQMEPIRSGFFGVGRLDWGHAWCGRTWSCECNAVVDAIYSFVVRRSSRVSTKLGISFGCPYRVEVKTQLNHSVVIVRWPCGFPVCLPVALVGVAARAACCYRANARLYVYWNFFSSLSRYFAFVCMCVRRLCLMRSGRLVQIERREFRYIIVYNYTIHTVDTHTHTYINKCVCSIGGRLTTHVR